MNFYNNNNSDINKAIYLTENDLFYSNKEKNLNVNVLKIIYVKKEIVCLIIARKKIVKINI